MITKDTRNNISVILDVVNTAFLCGRCCGNQDGDKKEEYSNYYKNPTRRNNNPSSSSARTNPILSTVMEKKLNVMVMVPNDIRRMNWDSSRDTIFYPTMEQQQQQQQQQKQQQKQQQQRQAHLQNKQQKGNPQKKRKSLHNNNQKKNKKKVTFQTTTNDEIILSNTNYDDDYTKERWYKACDYQKIRIQNWQTITKVKNSQFCKMNNNGKNLNIDNIKTQTTTTTEERMKLLMDSHDDEYCLRGLEQFISKLLEEESKMVATTRNQGTTSIHNNNKNNNHNNNHNHMTRKIYIRTILNLQKMDGLQFHLQNHDKKLTPENNNKLATIASAYSRKQRLIAKNRARQDEKVAFTFYKESLDVLDIIAANKQSRACI